MNMSALTQDISDIKTKNSSVTSNIMIFAVTYAMVWAYLETRGVETPHLRALVPAAAFVLSTLSMPYIKAVWLKLIYDLRKEKHHGIGN